MSEVLLDKSITAEKTFYDLVGVRFDSEKDVLKMGAHEGHNSKKSGIMGVGSGRKKKESSE